MINKIDIEQRVVRTVAAHLGIRRSELTVDSNLQHDLGADMLDRIELAITVGEEFGIPILPDDSTKVIKVSDLVNLVQLKLEQA